MGIYPKHLKKRNGCKSVFSAIIGKLLPDKGKKKNTGIYWGLEMNSGLATLPTPLLPPLGAPMGIP